MLAFPDFASSERAAQGFFVDFFGGGGNRASTAGSASASAAASAATDQPGLYASDDEDAIEPGSLASGYRTVSQLQASFSMQVAHTSARGAAPASASASGSGSGSGSRPPVAATAAAAAAAAKPAAAAASAAVESKKRKAAPAAAASSEDEEEPPAKKQKKAEAAKEEEETDDDEEEGLYRVQAIMRIRRQDGKGGHVYDQKSAVLNNPLEEFCVLWSAKYNINAMSWENANLKRKELAAVGETPVHYALRVFQKERKGAEPVKVYLRLAWYSKPGALEDTDFFAVPIDAFYEAATTGKSAISVQYEGRSYSVRLDVPFDKEFSCRVGKWDWCLWRHNNVLVVD